MSIAARFQPVGLKHHLSDLRRNRLAFAHDKRRSGHDLAAARHGPFLSFLLVGLWLPAWINLSGVKNMGFIQTVTTILKFFALAFMSTVGLFFIDGANYTPWNVSTQSTIAATGSGMAIALFSYIGVECASVAAGKVRDPDRNVPRATLFGTLATAVVYMLSLVAIFGIISTSTPSSGASFGMLGCGQSVPQITRSGKRSTIAFANGTTSS